MKLYPNLFAYLNRELPIANTTVLHGRDRPILTLDSKESIYSNSLLIPHNNLVYEIGFPYVKLSDWQHHNCLWQFELVLIINEIHHSLQITDEVLDEGAIEEEKQLEEWKKSQWSELLDNSVALLLQSYIGLFTSKKLWSDRTGEIAKIRLERLPEYLDKFNVSDATLPLVISLERQYELTRKLREIALKLRHQLRRQAELISIGRIQEMDSYCLRDYTRRPGRSPEEKGGSRQELMGVQRYQDYNTIENKFLVYFAGKVLHLECFRYEQSGATSYLELVKKFRQTIDIFKKAPAVATISSHYFQFTKPNYVLQQNPIYSSFYRAYLDYVYKRSEKEQVWSCRNNLLGDTVYLCLTAALLRFQGVNLKPLASLSTHTSIDRGNYLLENRDKSIPITIFLQQSVYEFRVEKNSNLSMGDYRLIIELHDLNSPNLITIKRQLPIWIFWYKPSDEVIAQAQKYINKKSDIYPVSILVYLQTPPNQSISHCELDRVSDRLWLCQVASPIETQGFSKTVEFFAQEVIKPLAEVL
jgi:hypothetical protein